MPMASASSGISTRKISRARLRSNPSNAARVGGAAACFGENSTTVSAIALLGAVLLPQDRLSQVLFDGREVGKQRAHLGRCEAAERRLHQFFPDRAQPLEERPRRRCEEEQLGAAVARARAPLDQAVVAQAVEEARQRDRLQIEHLGKLALLEALKPVEPREHRPFGTGHPERGCLLVRVSAEKARYVIDRKS